MKQTGDINNILIHAIYNAGKALTWCNGPRIKDEGLPSFTLTAQDRHGFLAEDGESCMLRTFTPLECERLQGLPDDFTKYYADGTLVSDSVRYQRVGRSISIPVVEAIGRGLNVFF